VATINRGRFTAAPDDELVVFLIGMRLNKPWKFWKWWAPFVAMPRMLRKLKSDPELGLLHVQGGLISGHPLTLCYFRSPQHLYRFAKDSSLPHLEPWRRFNKKVRDSGDVGVWHETYRVSPDRAECIYTNMPPWGLAAATNCVPVGRLGNSAEKRAGLTTVDEPVVVPF
jgi:hypothetical protein